MRWFFDQYLLGNKIGVAVGERLYNMLLTYKLHFCGGRTKKFIRYLNAHYPNLCITFLDAGARGGMIQAGAFKYLLYCKNKKLYAIEPDEVEAERLRKLNQYDFVYQDIIADFTGEAIFYVAEGSRYSSSYRKIDWEWAKYLDTEERPFKKIKEKPVKVKKMIDIHLTTPINFLKVDIEGCEMDMLASSDPTFFKELVGLRLETRAVPFWKGQGVTDEVLTFLKEKGLFLLQVESYKSALFLSDLVCVKDPRTIQTIEQVLKHCLFGFLFKNLWYVVAILKAYEASFGQQEEFDPIYNLIPMKRIGCSRKNLFLEKFKK